MTFRVHIRGVASVTYYVYVYKGPLYITTDLIWLLSETTKQLKLSRNRIIKYNKIVKSCITDNSKEYFNQEP